MPLLSIVTAALAPTPTHIDYVTAAYNSLLAQDDLGPWEWEWLLQEDGPAPQLREHLLPDPRIHYAAHGVALGSAASRTIALERARGTLVRTLDADDVLLPRGLSIPLDLLETHPSAVWAVGERWELRMPHEHIHQRPVSTVVPAGLVRPRLIADLLHQTGEVEIHCAGLTIRTDILRAFGGWMALPRSEDVIMLTAVNMFYPGAYTPEPTFLYRRWPSQITQQEWWIQMQPLARSILWQRQAALLALIEQSGPFNGSPTYSGPVDRLGFPAAAEDDIDFLRHPFTRAGRTYNLRQSTYGGRVRLGNSVW